MLPEVVMVMIRVDDRWVCSYVMLCLRHVMDFEIFSVSYS